MDGVNKTLRLSLARASTNNAPIPPTPTAYEIAQVVSHEEVVREIIVKINQGILEGRTIYSMNPMRGFLQGVSLGLIGQYDIDDPYIDAIYRLNPLTRSEVYAHIIGFIIGIAVWWVALYFLFRRSKTNIVRR